MVSSNFLSSISSHYKYLQNLKAAQASGQPFDYRSGTVGQAMPVQSGPTVAPFSPEYLQGYVSQFVPNFGAAGSPDTGQPYMINPVFFQFFSQMLFLQFMGAMQQQQQGQDGSLSWDQELPSRRGRAGARGFQFGRDPYLRGNNALDKILDRQNVSPGETDEDGDGYNFSDTDIQEIKDGLTAGEYTQKDLGIAIIAKMKRITGTAVDEYAGLIEKLVGDGTLDARVLFNPYLRDMNPNRQAMVSQALGRAGVLNNGDPNSAFNGYILSNLGNADKPDLQNFLRDLLWQYHQNVDDWGSEDGKATLGLFRLAGFKVNDDGTPVEGAEQPFELKAHL